MVLRQNATRRRRIVIDPKNGENDAGVAREETQTTARKPKRRLYKAGAERRFQWKTTDLLPKRRQSLLLVVGLLVIAVVGINLLHFYSDRWLNYIGAAGISSLQLTGRATLTAWFSSFLLIISSFASLQIYALRQHRQDDYRGSYRLWLWMAGVLFLASLNCIVDFTAIGTNLISGLSSLSFRSSLLSMICLKLVLLTALIARGSYEVRESRSSLMLVALIWIAFSATATLQLPQMQPVITKLPQLTFQIANGNLILFGTVFVFLAQLVFARFVYLQALGMIKQKVSKARKLNSKSKSKTKAKNKNSSSTSARSTRKKVSERADLEISDELADEESSESDSSRRTELIRKKQLDNHNFKSANSGKQNRHEVDSEDDSEVDSDQNGSILRISKSEQRRQRKQQQSSPQRRAA